MAAPAVATYRFGPFELRVDEHVLMRDGERVALSPKALDLLRWLVAHHGRVVDKKQLLDALWPDTHVEEANLSVQIAAIRKALGESGDAFIETIAKHGYRFVGPVQSIASAAGGAITVLVRPLTLVGASPDAEFLAFSLPHDVAASLADNPAICVVPFVDRRRAGHAETDSIQHAGADVVLRGTLGDVGGEPRVHVTLLDARSGQTLTTIDAAAPLSGLFELQKQITQEVERALFQRGSGEEVAARPTVPASPGAYVFYLRANQLAYETTQLAQARDLYEASVGEDPNYAPAWARLARCYRVIGKFGAPEVDARASFERAEAAFERALALDPALSLAHSLYAQLEVDVGKAREAMVRLLALATKRPHAAELYAGLVPALRFCGLLDWSIAAHAKARALDPGIPTSIHHTWWMKGDYAKALSETHGDIGYMPGLALASAGRTREAIAALRWRERESGDLRLTPYLTSLRALLENEIDESVAALDRAAALQSDGEAMYYVARSFAKLGLTDRCVSAMHQVIDGGFFGCDTFAGDPWLDPVRADPRVRDLLSRAQRGMAQAQAAFDAGHGVRVLSAR